MFSPLGQGTWGSLGPTARLAEDPYPVRYADWLRPGLLVCASDLNSASFSCVGAGMARQTGTPQCSNPYPSKDMLFITTWRERVIGWSAKHTEHSARLFEISSSRALN